FAYHAHTLDQEWIYILEGRARARIDGAEIDLAPGDFAAFPAPSVAHQLTNPFDREVLYLYGGDNNAVDILDYPDLDKRYLLGWDGRRPASPALGPAEYPFERLDAPPSPTAAPWRLFAYKGWGSAIAEAAMTLAGVAYERDLVNPREPGPAL